MKQLLICKFLIVLFFTIISNGVYGQSYVLLSDSIVIKTKRTPFVPNGKHRFYTGERIWIDSIKTINKDELMYVRVGAFIDLDKKIPIAAWVPKIDYADSAKFSKILKWTFATIASFCLGDYCPSFSITESGSLIRMIVPYEITSGEANSSNFTGECYCKNEKWNGKACVIEGQVFQFKNIVWMKIEGWENDDFFVLNKKGNLCSPQCCRFSKNDNCEPY